MRSEDPKIPYVSWRNGRPRFIPAANLRERGYAGEDLKVGDRWMTAGEALEWSITFRRQLEREKPKGKKRAAPKKAVPTYKPLTRAYPVQALWDDWLNLGQHPELADLAPKTIKNYRQCGDVLQRLAPDIWSSEVAALDKPICKGLYGKLRTAAGVNQAYNTMRALGVAIQWGLDLGRIAGLQINPAHKLKMKTPPPRIRVATVEEIEVLVKAADDMNWPEIGDAIIFGVWTGQRQADRLNFEFEGGSETRLNFRQEKTGALVSLPRAPEITKRLEAMQARRRANHISSRRVMLDERRREPFKPDYYRHVFDDVRAAASTRLPSIATLRDQDLRDTAVTWLARAGCTIPEICAITGHSFKTATDVLKHYLALHPEMADTAIAKMVAWHGRQVA